MRWHIHTTYDDVELDYEAKEGTAVEGAEHALDTLYTLLDSEAEASIQTLHIRVAPAEAKP